MRTPTVLPTLSPMSPTQVAQATNTSRRTVMRAIEAQDLQAFRDNRNHWKITTEAVEQWVLTQRTPSERAHTLPTLEQKIAQSILSPKEGENPLDEERQARLRSEIEAAELRGKLFATEAERDRLHEIIKALTSKKIKRRTWWPF